MNKYFTNIHHSQVQSLIPPLSLSMLTYHILIHLGILLKYYTVETSDNFALKLLVIHCIMRFWAVENAG